tara:strand:- start:36 stop:491 length:456 start_codon:yes stop_codon:yes gene_type:complete
MSHVAVVKVEVTDLKSLAKACEALGLQLNLGQKTYRWYGRHVGDYPLPEGFTQQDLGKCDHAISVPGKPGAYEVGLCSRNGGKSYQLLWDFWAGGHGLQELVGDDCQKLIHEYAKTAAKEELTSLAKAEQWEMKEEYNPQTGETTIRLRKY